MEHQLILVSRAAIGWLPVLDMVAGAETDARNKSTENKRAHLTRGEGERSKQHSRPQLASAYTPPPPPDQRQSRGGGVRSGALLPAQHRRRPERKRGRPPERRRPDGRRRHSLPPLPRRRRPRPAPLHGVVRRPVRGRLQGLRQPDLPGGRPTRHGRGALFGPRRAVGLRKVLQDLLGVGLLRLRLRLRPLPVPGRPVRARLLLLRRPRHVLLARPLWRRRRGPGPAQRLPRALRDLRLPPGLRRPDALQDLRLRGRRRRGLRDSPRHRIQPARGGSGFQRRRVLRHQLPAGVRAGAVRGRPLQRRLQQLRHPGRAARRGRVRRRPLRPGLPRQVLHYLQLLPPRRAPWRRRRPRRAADSQDCSHRAGWSLGPGFPGHLLALRQKPGQEEGRLLTWKHGGRS